MAREIVRAWQVSSSEFRRDLASRHAAATLDSRWIRVHAFTVFYGMRMNSAFDGRTNESRHSSTKLDVVGAAVLAPRSTFWSRGRLLRRQMNIFDGLMVVGNPFGIHWESVGWNPTAAWPAALRRPSSSELQFWPGLGPLIRTGCSKDCQGPWNHARLLSCVGTGSLHRAAPLSLWARTPYGVVERRGAPSAEF